MFELSHVIIRAISLSACSLGCVWLRPTSAQVRHSKIWGREGVRDRGGGHPASGERTSEPCERELSFATSPRLGGGPLCFLVSMSPKTLDAAENG